MIALIELFAGIGSQTQALKNIGIEHKVIGISEIDKYAIKAYKQLHGEVNNFGDITKIESLPYCDLLTYSFPCQDLSIVGKQAGIKEGTRSGLLLEVDRLIDNMPIKPKYLLLENVKGLLQEKHLHSFHHWLNRLSQFGYVNYCDILNAKDCGIPQNRERVFVVSIRQDIKQWFNFPDKQELKIFLFALLEKEVDNKYYVSENVKAHIFNKMKYNSLDENITQCQTARQYASWNGQYIIDYNFNRPVRKYKKYSPALKLNSKTQCAVLQKEKIRRLTPLECFKLMGFKDEQFNKIKDISDSQLYKLAGNSIVVNVLEAIFKQLFKEVNK
jgi:DNA (cytosine-5)-methyltransferase 1